LGQQTALARDSVRARWPADSKIAFFRFSWAAPEPGATPDEPVLLTAWEVAGKRGGTLAQIDTGLDEFSKSKNAAQRYKAGLVYDRYVPALLGKVEFVPSTAGQ
jgi:hypothetical protein